VSIIHILNSYTIVGLEWFSLSYGELHVVSMWGFVRGHISFTFQLNVE